MRWIRQITDRYRIAVRATTALGALLLLWGGCWLLSTGERGLPTPHFSSATPPVSTARCAECHPGQAQSLAQAPHSLTLHHASSPEIVARFDGLIFRDKTAAETTNTFEFREQQLWRKCSAYPDPIPIDWIFGSDRHAQTPVTVRETPRRTTELLEHGLSHYPGVGLGLTLGTAAEATTIAPGWHGLGKRMTSSEATDCFGCHTTWLPSDGGRLDLKRLVAGVQCTRCHLGGEAHLAAAHAGQTDLRMERWQDLSPLESIRRCGECHRRDDQLTADELRPDNLLLVRFAPVGLSQSQCFQSQAEATDARGTPARMDCMTCHDPHRPAEREESFYNTRCLNCHGSHPGHASHCSSKTSTDHCLGCHMPKVEVQTHLQFTDHWIRKRQD